MYQEELEKYAGDILNSENFQSTKEYIQHGNMSVYEHCINVAKMSLIIRDHFKIKCHSRDLIRGALLHDYFLYDWHTNDKVHSHRLHGFFHPGRALRNARKEYVINMRQTDIIIKHMWPLTVVPPMCREAWIVTMADKYCSAMETLRIQKGRIHMSGI
ncbi:MAG: phosphohydrolase [Roseburia sp.]|nr:phosphohydrolase [Roseburia sp.]